MGVKKSYKRKKRRRMNAKTRSQHRLIGGRTGSKRLKQRAGMLHEAKRRKES